MKTSELTGPALDWAVLTLEQNEDCAWYIDERGRLMEEHGEASAVFDPSTNWSQGGPIIEREGISTEYLGFDIPPYWVAHSLHKHFPKKFGAIGPTPLVAAMRCFVASKLGDKIEVPEGLE